MEKASHNQDYEDIAQEIFRLRDQKEKSFMNDTSRAELLARINEMEEFITSQPSEITEFDENPVRKLLAKVTIYEEKLVFEFKFGVSVEIEQRIVIPSASEVVITGGGDFLLCMGIGVEKGRNV